MRFLFSIIFIISILAQPKWLCSWYNTRELSRLNQLELLTLLTKPSFQVLLLYQIQQSTLKITPLLTFVHSINCSMGLDLNVRGLHVGCFHQVKSVK